MNQAAHPRRKSIAVIGIRGLPANYGGLETCAEEVTRRWVAQGHEVRVYCRSKHYAEHPSEINGVDLVYTSSISTKSLDTITHTLFSILHLIFTGRRFKYVHLYNTGNSIFMPLLKLFGKKVILSGDGIEWKREKWGALAKWVHRTGEKCAVMFADVIVVDNQEVGNYYQSRHGVATEMIAYGANDLELEPEYSHEILAKYNLKAGRYFLFVGRLVQEKGVHSLIAAYKKLNTEYPLVIIGDDTSESAYRNNLFAQQCENIRFLGFIYDKEYEQLLLTAYMYLSASELEGTSPSLVSAMGASVCSLVNGIDENIATVHESAYTYRRNDIDDLVRLWQELIDSPEKVKQMAAKGRACVEQFYRWDAIADQYLVVMEKLS